MCGWSNDKSTDDWDWLRTKGATTSYYTGPTTDHTTNSDSGKCLAFLYLSNELDENIELVVAS